MKNMIQANPFSEMCTLITLDNLIPIKCRPTASCGDKWKNYRGHKFEKFNYDLKFNEVILTIIILSKKFWQRVLSFKPELLMC